MTSQINPQNIDGTYPVAGQDNDSQGFRDNFTNTKTNFEYAAAEITDLQSKAVLKSALTGSSLNNNMGGSLLYNAVFQDIAETLVPLGTQSGSQTLDYSLGPYFTLTTSGSVSLGFSNWPANGTVGRIRLRIFVTNTSHQLTLPAAVSLGTYNIQGISSNVITFNQTGTYEFEFETSDGGTTVIVIDQNRNFDPIYLPSYEDLANAGTVDVTVTTSWFTTGGAETATLPAAPFGMIKVLYARDVTAGAMVITVSGAAAWGGAGTITFNNTGDACTLMSTGGGWLCIGNNGAVFA